MEGESHRQPGLAITSGARYYRCALQVNPYGYAERFRGEQSLLSEGAYAEALVGKAVDLGISVFAVTDHNHVGGIAAIREEASKHGIHVFPGFELSSSEGIHVLCIYPINSPEEELGRFLGAMGIFDTSPSAQLSNKNFSNLIETVKDQGGVTVAAHITSRRGGLLRALSGQPRIALWKDPNLLAVQIPGAVEDLPQEYRAILQNENPDYRREHPRLAIAAVNAKDVIGPETLSDPAASCWIKMSEVSIEGLRQAFLDPGSRIRLGDPAPDQHAEFLQLSWEGGFLNGTTINFNSDLNVVIGGRGAGKSTVVESIRYVLGIDPLGEDSQKSHRGIVQEVLKSGTKLSLSVQSSYPVQRNYKIERTVPNPPVVFDSESQTSSLRPTDVLPGVEVYGQHEISDLSKDSGKLTKLLSRFMESDEGLNRQKLETKSDLEKTRRRILEMQSEITQIEEGASTLPRLEETLEGYRRSGLEKRLRERSLLVREEGIIDSLRDRLLPFKEGVDMLRQELPIDRTFLSEKALGELPAKETLAPANEIFDALSDNFQKIVSDMETELVSADQQIVAIRTKWEEHANKIRASYERTLRELQKEQIDGEEFIRLRRQIEELRPLRERQGTFTQMKEEVDRQRRSLLMNWEDIKAKEFRILDEAARTVGNRLKDRVRVNVQAAMNREPLIRMLRDRVGGQLQQTEDLLRVAEDFSLPKFVETCRKGSEALRTNYSLTPSQSSRIADAGEETFMLLEELELEAKTTIELNTAPIGQSPDWKTLRNLSTGQKATAVLLLLLLNSDAPLVVDQPEDDLDNRFITEEVIPRMRDEKRNRQFVFSTHNANIPVLGDAELILGLSAFSKEAHIQPEHRGAIDSESVRDLVEEVLEGGKEAFETRRRKYGF